MSLGDELRKAATKSRRETSEREAQTKRLKEEHFRQVKPQLVKNIVEGCVQAARAVASHGRVNCTMPFAGEEYETCGPDACDALQKMGLRATSSYDAGEQVHQGVWVDGMLTISMSW